jgi:hypothetical protein
MHKDEMEATLRQVIADRAPGAALNFPMMAWGAGREVSTSLVGAQIVAKTMRGEDECLVTASFSFPLDVAEVALRAKANAACNALKYGVSVKVQKAA